MNELVWGIDPTTVSPGGRFSVAVYNAHAQDCVCPHCGWTEAHMEDHAVGHDLGPWV